MVYIVEEENEENWECYGEIGNNDLHIGQRRHPMMGEMIKDMATLAILLLVVYGLIILEGYAAKQITGTEAVFLSGSVLAVVAAGALIWLATFASARDIEGRFADASPEIHKWFQNLHAKDGGTACCDLGDGRTVEDADWQSKDRNYQVFLGGRWIDVPPGAVVEQPNIYGKTVVWTELRDGELAVKCFLPGVMM